MSAFSSQEAKRDFIKTIHNTIRESVRRMSIPGPRSQGPPHKRPDTLPGPPASPQGSVGSSVSVGKKKGKLIRGELGGGVRHSMDIDDKLMDSAIGTRSRTLTDLNKMDDGGGYPSGSQSTIASEASRSSARLLHASNTPHNYTPPTQNTTKEKDGLGSPIWKPRHAGPAGVKKTRPGQPAAIEERHEFHHHHHPVVSGVSAYGDYSNIVYDDKNTSRAAAAAASVMMQHPNAYVEYEDTDC